MMISQFTTTSSKAIINTFQKYMKLSYKATEIECIQQSTDDDSKFIANDRNGLFRSDRK